MSIFLLPQYLLPQRLLSRLLGKIARCQWPWLKNFIIKHYCKFYHIDLSEAQESEYRNYGSFDDFFTRALKPGARNLTAEAAAIISPVDGTIYQLGKIIRGQMIYAKGKGFTLEQLLGNSVEAALYEGGDFIVIYLAPSDYHRIHMPLAGKLCSMRYIPGKLFSVKPSIVEIMSDIFARNERVAVNFSCSLGPITMVLVGAMVVGSIATIWAGIVAPQATRQVTDWSYVTEQMEFSLGEEVGRFHLGSTVILIFPKDSMCFSNHLIERAKIRMGEPLGIFKNI